MHILRSFGMFYETLVYFMGIWYNLLPFGIFHDDLVYFMRTWYISMVPFGTIFASCTERNLATLTQHQERYACEESKSMNATAQGLTRSGFISI
jgi:hypothetical protein